MKRFNCVQTLLCRTREDDDYYPVYRRIFEKGKLTFSFWHLLENQKKADISNLLVQGEKTNVLIETRMRGVKLLCGVPNDYVFLVYDTDVTMEDIFLRVDVRSKNCCWRPINYAISFGESLRTINYWGVCRKKGETNEIQNR